MNQFYHNLLSKIPYVKKLQLELDSYKSKMNFVPGHFYSAIVDWKEIKDKNLWDVGLEERSEIFLNIEEQKSLASSFNDYYCEIPWSSQKQEGLRYYFQNPYYSFTDGIFLFSMMRYFMPQRIIEVGSGFSSAVMVDTNELFFKNSIELNFIEPYPERLNSLLDKNRLPNTKVLEKKVQEIPLEYFDQLQKGDFLFVDSSHVSKTGSDVNHILFNIIPRLQKGVFIHFHDIFYPFEYPRQWVFEGRNWNEIYLLRAFLMNNANYKIRLFSSFLHSEVPDVFELMQLCKRNEGGNLWLEKV